MMQPNLMIRDLSKEFIAQNYPQEAEDFDLVWELMPDDLRGRDPMLPDEAEMRFWDQMAQNPIVADIVIGICAAILYDLGKWSGNKLVGLVTDETRLAAFRQTWSAKANDLALVSNVVDFVYERFTPADGGENGIA
jgi:hypothetical protein